MKRRGPNVLWIMCDQLSRLALPAFGGPYAVETPHVDRLAREGTVFETCYTPSPVCVPARFSALTGLYPHRTGCVGNNTPLPMRFRTAAHHFGRQGFVTAMVGKMHPVDAQTHGFDVLVDFGHYYDYLGPKTAVFAQGMGAADSGCGVPWVSTYTGGRSPWRDVAASPTQPDLLEEEDHPDSFFAREACRFLEQYGRDEAPFFLFVSFLRPHKPFAPPRRFAERYTPEWVCLPPPPKGYDPERVPPQARPRPVPGAFTPEGDAAARAWIAPYCGNVAHVDDCTGRILGALDRLNLAEDTLIMFMSDHGDMLYDHGLAAKFSFFDASSRVPLIIRWPGRVRAGARCGEVVDLGDLVPTCLEAAGAPVPEGLGGSSFWGACDPGGRRPKGWALSELALGGPRPMYMLRTERWKFNRYVQGQSELYDMRADPGEVNNLADEVTHQAVVQELSARLDGLIGEEAARCQRQGRPLPPLPE